MWHRARQISRWNIRRLCTAVRRRVEDEGDWIYSSEWWGTDDSQGCTVFRSTSDQGNGVVSVLAYPSSRPSKERWSEMERWLQQRYREIHPSYGGNSRFRVLGYRWCTLHFNDDTRQSTVKIMAACQESEPGSVCLMQQPHCLAVPYLKSMVSTGLATVASNFDLVSAVRGEKTMNILCIGHGGGSLPLFLASKIQGAVIHSVEIDPVVISASIQAMGFPSYSLMTPSGERALSKPNTFEKVLWKGTHERLNLYQSDAEKFILENTTIYDLVFIDAYDGDDIFPRKLWDPDSPFVKALCNQLHSEHGTVVVNLHSDSEVLCASELGSYSTEQLLLTGRYVSSIGRAYKDVLLGNGSSGSAYIVSVPWVCNSTLVAGRGLGISKGNHNSSRDSVLETLITKSLEMELVLDLPFPCFQFVKRDFTLID